MHQCIVFVCFQNQKKVKELEEEMIYGSKPVTPGKRRFIGTPARTPNKMRKVGVTLLGVLNVITQEGFHKKMFAFLTPLPMLDSK